MPEKQLSDEYLAYIDSEAWRRRRALKLLMAGGRSGFVSCEMCQTRISVKSAHVHHLTYERFKRERMSDLSVFCSACHGVIEEIDLMADGGDAMEMSAFLVSWLAAIDNRIILMQERPIPGSKRDPSTITEADIAEIIARRRREFGISPPSEAKA